jgi:hypothetical protein
MTVAVSSRGFDVVWTCCRLKPQDDVMVNTHISISRVFTALTRLDSGVETNWKIDLGEIVRGVPAIDFALICRYKAVGYFRPGHWPFRAVEQVREVFSLSRLQASVRRVGGWRMHSRTCGEKVVEVSSCRNREGRL